jgi:hypothetical protein
MRFVLLRALGQAFVAADVPERDLIGLFEAER